MHRFQPTLPVKALPKVSQSLDDSFPVEPLWWLHNTRIARRESQKAHTHTMLTGIQVPHYFDRPNDFVPERWYSLPGWSKTSERSCRSTKVGSSGLSVRMALPLHFVTDDLCQAVMGAFKNVALSELQVVIALLVAEYCVKFAPDEDRNRVVSEMTDRFTALPGPLSLTLERRVSKD